MVLGALVAALCWLSPARAGDAFEKEVRFQISASPLASALIEFSTQSGLQVAAADADLSRLNAHGVTGTLPVRAALSQLPQGTGLSFSRIGAETVAIRAASVGPSAGLPEHTARSSGAISAPAAKAADPDSDLNAGTLPEIPDVTVTAPRPPADSELAGDSLHQFVVHHATVHYVNTGVTGNLAHWRGGKQSICPLAVGLDPGYNAFITARLRALATYVGAPVQPDVKCKDNVRILFTTDPQKMMGGVVQWASHYFSPRGEYAQMKRLIAFRGDHAIQGWYLTSRGGARVLNGDFGLLSLNLVPLWPQITPSAIADDGDMSGISVVFLIVDTNKVAGEAIGTIADYVAVLALSVVQSPDHCDVLPSILDLMSPSCGTREAECSRQIEPSISLASAFHIIS